RGRRKKRGDRQYGEQLIFHEYGPPTKGATTRSKCCAMPQVALFCRDILLRPCMRMNSHVKVFDRPRRRPAAPVTIDPWLTRVQPCNALYIGSEEKVRGME